MIQDELEKRGLKMKVIEEPEGQPIVNEDETPKNWRFELRHFFKGL